MTSFETRITEDGSKTFYSSEFGETFHTKYGAKTEAEITYIKGCQIPEKIKYQNHLRILDICFGLGYNTAAAIDYILKENPQCFIEIIGLELDENVPIQALNNNLLNDWQPTIVDILQELIINKQVISPNFKLSLLIGDARDAIASLVEQNWQGDAIFLDPFSPPKCPQLWTVEFLSLVAKCLNQEGILATYSCSAAVRTALQLAGLKLGANFCIGRRSPGTLASYNERILPPLSLMELEHLQTRASIPFRDLSLRDTAEIIKKRREKEQLLSNLESTSKWKKRWFNPKKLRKLTDDNPS
ncbi:tRNA (5-methylaminomethyl-2-thiouridine)(34)-methyltransferase MnmD [Cyanobacterium aponinum]|uniref:MnmC-like methyltransferase domain-containing protein n=1 Tax=Cyanobacterium aponinum (strain PCC 10605) TaxID=755178 RepID=K9Z4H3_CYAAP|nr:MnmC family methyltransferase [Cyanobacterium aponinum]AFZ54039.1 protein of unknown function DUF752 [Cyanobacterium aponinum PCC 10605]